MAEEVTPKQARVELARRELERRNAPPKSIQKNLEGQVMSDLSPGRNILGLPGPSLADIPGVSTNIMENLTLGMPTSVTKRPILTAALGPQAAQVATGMDIGVKAASFASGRGFKGQATPEGKVQLEPPLQPFTPAGKAIGMGAGLLSPLLGPGKFGFSATANTVKATATRIPAVANATVKDIQFAERVQNTAFQTIKNAGEKFADDITKLEGTNPKQAVDLTESIQNFLFSVGENADVLRRIKSGVKASGNRGVIEFFETVLDPTQTISLAKSSLKESQEILRAVKKAPGLIAKFIKGKQASFDPNDIPLIEFINDIRTAQLSAFPQFSNTLKSFSETMQKWKQVKGFFKAGKTIGAVKGKFGDPQLEKMAFKMLSPKVIEDIGGVRNVMRVANGLKWVGIVAGGSAVAGLVGAGALRNVVGGGGGGGGGPT